MYCGIVTYAPALALEQVANFQLEIGLDRKVNGMKLDRPQRNERIKVNGSTNLFDR